MRRWGRRFLGLCAAASLAGIVAAPAAGDGPPACLLADANCDGRVTFDDIDAFVAAIVGQCVHQAQFPGCYWRNSDCNEDGLTDFNDIDSFIRCLITAGCPPRDVQRCAARAIAQPQHATAQADHGVTIVLPGGGTDRVTFEIDTPPRHGGLGPITVVPPNLALVRYTPDTGFVDTDVFTYRVSLPSGESSSADVIIDVARPPTLPAGCPHVALDADGTFVVNGERFFPIGFWGAAHVQLRDETWDEYAGHFSSLVAGVSPLREPLLTDAGLRWIAQAGLRVEPSPTGGAVLSTSELVRLAQSAAGDAVIAWEARHEPDTYPVGSLDRDVAAQAAAIRLSDPCGRPVMVTPTAGAQSFFAEAAASTDLTAMLYYPVPRYPILAIRDQVARIRSYGNADPLIYTTRVAGWQTGRYREYAREATAAEVRAAAALAITLGVRGVCVFNHSRADPDRDPEYEPYDSSYNIEDSPALYADLKRVGDELLARAPLWACSFSAWPAPSADLGCALFDVNGALPGGEYLLAVNVADDPSPYFDFAFGGRVEYLRAYAYNDAGPVTPASACNNGIDDVDPDGRTDGRADLADCVTPESECDPFAPELCDCDCTGPEDSTESWSYPWYARTLGPGGLMIRRITPRLSPIPEVITGVRVYIAGAAPGTLLQAAVYADALRDQAPNQRLYLSPPFSVAPATPDQHWVDHRLPAPLLLESTREYFIAFKVTTGSATVHWQDLRQGAYIRPGAAVDLLASFPPLHRGRVLSTSIPTPPGFSRYRAVRTLGAAADEPGEIANSAICDTFAPYAVHLYQLLP